MAFDQAREMLKLRKKAKELQKALRQMRIEGEAGGVKVILNGEQKIEELEIADELLSVERKFELKRLIKEAFTDAADKAQKQAASKMKEVGGFDIPGLR